MMVNGIGSSSFDYQLNSVSSSSNNSSLSYEQQQSMDEILSEYDGNNLSESDAKAIVSAFQDAGISPSREMADAMDSLGFDAHEVGTLAGVGPQGGSQAMGGMPPPPPPPPSNSESEEEFNTVSSLLETLFNSDDENDNTSSTFDDLMDYTSRVVNLNESSKSDVMEILEKYGNENSEYTLEEKNAFVMNSLNSILGDNNNYNHTSFYG